MIYVDDAKIPATMHGRLAVWSHLVAIPLNQSELLEFGEHMGLKASWLQAGNYTHFDVTESKREQAILLGATPVTARELVELIQAERKARE